MTREFEVQMEILSEGTELDNCCVEGIFTRHFLWLDFNLDRENRSEQEYLDIAVPRDAEEIRHSLWHAFAHGNNSENIMTAAKIQISLRSLCGIRLPSSVLRGTFQQPKSHSKHTNFYDISHPLSKQHPHFQSSYFCINNFLAQI